MTPAEFKTIRERLGLSGEAFGRILERQVIDRTVRRWESGQLPIPPDAERTLLALDAEYEQITQQAVQHARLVAQDMGGSPEAIHLLRYSSQADLEASQPMFAVLGPGAHGALVGRAREALVREGIKVRIVLFNAGAYHAWRTENGMTDTERTRSAWAATQVGLH